MTSRERLQASLKHRQPDRVPIDFGSTFITGIHCSVVEELRRYYALEHRPVKVHEPYQMLGVIEADLQDSLQVDVEGVYPPTTIFGFENDTWQHWRTPWGQEVLVSTKFQTTTTAQGDVYIYPKGDRTALASGHMPAGGFFFDSIIRQEPIDEERLNPQDNLEEFTHLTDQDLQRVTDQVQARETSARGSVLATPGTSLGDIALVPAPFLIHPKGIRDVAEWYMSVATRQLYVQEVFERQTEIAIQNLTKIYKKIGNSIDAVALCGTDFGTQTSRFCSVDTFRSLWLPHYRRMNDWIHANTQWKTFKHSCGAVEPLIQCFIDAGFDILNPVQCSATGMDPKHLKNTYGKHIAFWGGGIDTQRLLPFGTPSEIKEQVKERLEIFSHEGGYVFNSIHNVQARTPIHNLVAMFEAVHEFNGTR